MAYTLREIAEIVGGEVVGDDRCQITGINSLNEGSPGEISFFADQRYRDRVKETRVSALLVTQANDLFHGPQVVVDNPALACAKLANLFAPPPPAFSGVSRRAHIHENSRIGENVTIYPLVYVGDGAVIGNDVTLFPGAYVGDRVRIGDKTVIHPNVSVLHDCVIGDEVIIHAGSVIGGDGFGFVREGRSNIKIPQIGIVQIDEQVEIGANNTIDRATLGKTWIKRGVKTDNLVHVAHNVVIGEDTIIVAQTALAGSVQIGKGVVIGGQVAVADHVRVEDGAMIGSQSGVPKSISKGEIVSGTPAMPHRIWLKTSGLIPRLPQLYDRLRHLEKKIDALEKQLAKEK